MASRIKREKEIFLGTFAITDIRDAELLAKLLIERNKGNEFYQSPLVSDEQRVEKGF